MLRRSGWFAGLFGAVALFAAACAPPNPGGGNQLPTAVIVATPTSGSVPLTVSFDGSGSTDPDGAINAYAWTFGDGGTSSDPAASHTYTSVGTYTASLKVTDNGGFSDTKTVTITVGAVAPTASLVATPTSGKEPLTVAFDASGSTDDGTIVSYAWVFGDGSTGTGATASHVYTAAGSYAATLTVTDNDGATDTESQVIVVTPNQAPDAVASGTPSVGKEPLTVAFSSAGSNDPDGTITYAWDFDTNGSIDSTLANPSFTYTTFGNKTATLTVTDDNGATASNTVSTTVNANVPPTAVANATPSGGFVPLTVLFNGSSSTDSDGTIVSYLWDFNDGTFSNFPNPSHTYGSIGTYNASLTVTDDNGVTNTDVVPISVNGIPNVPPTAAASGTPTSGKVPLTVAFSSAGSIDTDGSIVGYAWDFGDGTSSGLANPSKTYNTPGARTATLTVTDNNGATATATVGITVNPNQAPNAAASATPTSGKEPLTVSFSSAGSSDPDGTIVSRSWDFGDGTSSSAANPTKTYNTFGTFTATLTISDDNGDTATATASVVVNQNVAPTAVLNASPTTGPRALTVSFNSSASVDPDGTIVSRSLNFGDGTGTSSAAVVSHTYAAGTWTAQLTVTDDNGVSSTTTQVITVYVDDDGDGFSPNGNGPNSGTDCDDGSATTFPGAADPLDGPAIDSNCDGVDGVLATTILVSPTLGADNATCGTAVATPCQTIAQAIIRAGTTRPAILLASSSGYAPLSVVGSSGLTLRGGYPATFVGRSGTSVLTGASTITNATGLTVRDLTITGVSGFNATGLLVSGGTVTLNSVTITSGAASGAGSSAYGLRALNSANVTVQSSNISASAGVSGVNGTTPSGALTAGTNGASGSNGNTDDPNPPQGATGGGTGANNGGNGGNANSGSGQAGVNGGTGGGGGCSNCRSNSNYSGAGAGGGTRGNNGSTGAHGAGGAAGYGSTWSPSAATNAAAGTNGGGGGGGGAGGQGCNATFCAGQRVSGGSGGKGGGGGQGGAGGTAGTAAGGSFAVYSQNSTVAIDANTTLSAANGGNGGNGAIGQNGASGGAGGNGGSGIRADCCTGGGGGGGAGGAANTNGNGGGDGFAGTCCNGGSGGGGGGGGGGNGGIGGSGGGGAGGPSVAMLSKGSGGITFAGNLAAQVTIGTGGSGGSSPNGGNAGVAGATTKTLTVA